MAARKIISSKALQQKNFVTLRLHDRFHQLMGEVSTNFRMMCYGNSGSGKSVFALQIAEHVAELQNGKVLYDSHEEGLSKSIQARFDKFSSGYPKLYVANKLSHEERMDAIKRRFYRVVVIDSVQYANMTDEQLKEMTEAFAKRKLIVILVSFGKSLGSTKGADDLLHDCDVKLFFKSGMVTCQSRFKDEQVEHRLFTPKNTKAQADLFNNPQIV